MSRLSRFFARLFTSLRHSRAEDELARELDAHLQLLEDKFIAQGMTPAEARAAARREFHGVEQTKELQRDARGFRSLAGWKMDLKLGVRMLLKSPGLTVIGVVALAVAIGMGAAYMEFVNDFFRPKLAFRGADRLVGLLNWDVEKNDVERRSMHEYVTWKERLTTVDLGAATTVSDNLSSPDGRLEPVEGVEITASVFTAVPVAPLHGRPLTSDDEALTASPVMVLSERLWRARFNGDASIVGQTVRFGDVHHTVVGVMPRGFGFPINSNFWVPLRVNAAAVKPNEGQPVRMFGQLREGVTVEQAQAELETVARATAVDGTKRRAIVQPFVESLWNNGNMLWQVRLLYGLNVMFIALLGICAANIATLVFARTATREGEITVRTALGASRGRIVSQLIAEAFVLTSIAAIAGLLGAVFMLRFATDVWETAQGEPLPFWWNEQLGVETILYTVLLVVISSLVIGGLPAMKATGARMQSRLKAAGAHGGTMRFGKLWTSVIVGQVAVTAMFLLALIGIGWDAFTMGRYVDGVPLSRNDYVTATVMIGNPEQVYTPAEEAAVANRERNALREMVRRLNEDPAVVNATWAMRLPGSGVLEYWVEFAEPQLTAEADARKKGGVLWVGTNRIGSNFFETFGQRLVDGRNFSTGEIESGAKVAIVDETFVRVVLGGRKAVGLQVREPSKEDGEQPGPWLEIVGVVSDLSAKADKTNEDAMLYQPLVPGDNWMKRVIIHTQASDAAARIRRAAAGVDPDIRLYEVMTLQQWLDMEKKTVGFFTTGLAMVSAVALLLSTAGIYSLIAFTLSRRTREIGIRIALGAGPGRIVRGILSRAMVQIAIGVVLGTIPGLVLLTGMFDAAATNTAVAVLAAVGVATFVLTVAAVSCIGPVRRALGIDPIHALRAEG